VHQRNATITVLVSQILAVSVTATPSLICAGSTTQLLATVNGGNPPYTYAWTSNPAGFVSNQPNPVASPTVNTWYKCTVHDNVNTIVMDSVYVTVISIPAAPGAITGNLSPCMYDTADYSIAAVTGATSYNWTVPAGASIISGQSTTAISVLWGSTSGNVTVTAGNSCGNSSPSQITVTLSPLPEAPGAISGPSTVCTNTTVTYSIPDVTGVTINWTVPADATIISGQGTDSITVEWGVSSGNVSVTTQNSCGTSYPSILYVVAETVAGAAQAITGPDTVCQGQAGNQYSIPVIPNATNYIWTLPPGASISQGQGTNVVQVDFSGTALSGNLTAAGNNMCGTGTESSMYVDVIVCTGIDVNTLQSEIMIYPNPANDILTLSIKGTEKQLRVRITDLIGHCLYDESLNNLPAAYIRQIDVSSFSKGHYMIKLTNDSRVFVSKIAVK
jgi:hypothetical protein